VRPSDVDLLSNLDCIVDLNAEVPHGALNLGMSKQKLYGSQVARPPVDQYRLSPPQRMGAELRWIKAYAGNPLVNEPRILSRRQSQVISATGKEELPGFPPCHPKIVINCRASLIGQLEPHRPARLLLPDRLEALEIKGLGRGTLRRASPNRGQTQAALTEATTHSVLGAVIRLLGHHMSKRFKNKTCGYCGGVSATGDHVLGRGFVLVEHRHGLPEIPACQECNGQKSRFESHLMQLLPLGGNMADPSRYTHGLMAPRAANPVNKLLREVLDSPHEVAILRDQHGNKHERIPVLIDAVVLEQWYVWMARGLAFHHWGIVVGKDFSTEVVALAAANENALLDFARSVGSNLIEAEIGGGVLAYRGVRFPNDPNASAWVLSLYGGMPIGGDPEISTACAKSWGVFIEPQRRASAA
jgi:hypothetical protein